MRTPFCEAPPGILSLAFALLLTPLVSSALTFDDWKTTHFSAGQLADPAISGGNSDPDGDGRCNFGEFALDTNPFVPDRNISFDVFVDAGGHWSVRYLRWKDRPALLYIPQITSELNGFWRSGPSFFPEVNVTDRDTLSEWVTAQDPVQMSFLSSRFVRLLLASDQDRDGLPDEWELLNGLDMGNPYDATSDLDGDGLTAQQEFANGTDPLAKPVPPPQQTIPAAPVNVQVQRLDDGSCYVRWDDVSVNEQYFVIYEYHSDGRVTELARTGANETSVFIPAKP